MNIISDIIDNESRRCHLIDVSMGRAKADIVLKNANYLNVFTNTFQLADIAITNGVIAGIAEKNDKKYEDYTYSGDKEIDICGKAVVPGFIDGHMHLESSIVIPDQYAEIVLPHGTTSIVADPHEIANVLGKKGIDYILDVTDGLLLDVYIMMSSCVPASMFDEAGAVLNAHDIEEYMNNTRVLGLAELMNYPGVVNADTDVIGKIQKTLASGKIVDGHAPGLSGKSLDAYIASGVTSDHECTTYDEALTKLSHGQWIMIREGTACKNLKNLCGLIKYPYSDRCMFVTDDKHPGDLYKEGHIDHIIRKSIALGASPELAYKVASYNAARYFDLKGKGAIAPGYIADMVVLNDINSVSIASVYKNGKQVACNGILDKIYVEKMNAYSGMVYEKYKSDICDTVNTGNIDIEDIVIKKEHEKVIGLIPGEIITTDEGYASGVDVENDILKMCVVERHKATGNTGVAYVKGYGLKKGAVATSIAHDSHNVIVVGTNDADILCAIKRIHTIGGGMVVVCDGQVLAELPLPIAGLMCSLDGMAAQEKMDMAKKIAHDMGVYDNIDPFMTLSFVSLPVIPKLRLTTLGVVDVDSFKLLD